jgi:hypothetical protein
MAACSGNHLTRLFVGEASFKGTEALVNKHRSLHPNLAQSIIATELSTFSRTSDLCQRCVSFEKRAFELTSAMHNLFCPPQETVDYSNDPYSNTFFCSDLCKRIYNLKAKGVTVILGFDATQIHTNSHPKIAGKRISRIHWNCPHDKSNFKDQTLPPIIKSFFKSASRVQKSGDRIYVTLAQPEGKTSFYQGYVYNIRNAASSSGYRLFAKRPFGPIRYPGYKHEITGSDDSAKGAERQREFVFVKSPFSFPAGRAISEYNSDIYYGKEREYYIRDTDDESSDYSDS